MGMKVVANLREPSDECLQWACQIGLDGVDHLGGSVPGLKERGTPNMPELHKVIKRIRSWGLSIHRVSLPTPGKFMAGQPGGEKELDDLCTTLRCYGEAGIPIARVHFPNEATHIGTTHLAEHRGGYKYRGFDLELWQQQLAENPPETEIMPEEYWDRVKGVYERIVPVAEEAEVKLAMHPSDPPLPGAPFDTLGYHKVIDACPSDYNGYLYCVGTRCEAGGTQVVLDEINKYGRMGKIFHVHFRNVRGNLASTGGFEEVLLDDGDMNMFQILLALRNVGYEGALNPDHHPHIGPPASDGSGSYTSPSYAIGYIKGLLAALAAQPQVPGVTPF
jgi:mannonate dehydratase